MGLIVAIFVVIFIVFGKVGVIPAGELLFGLVISIFFCQISPEVTYTWYSGIWHGLCFIPNLVWSLGTDTLYKAVHFTWGYNLTWWLMVIVTVGITVYLYYPTFKVFIKLFGKR